MNYHIIKSLIELKKMSIKEKISLNKEFTNISKEYNNKESKYIEELRNNLGII